MTKYSLAERTFVTFIGGNNNNSNATNNKKNNNIVVRRRFPYKSDRSPLDPDVLVYQLAISVNNDFSRRYPLI